METKTLSLELARRTGTNLRVESENSSDNQSRSNSSNISGPEREDAYIFARPLVEAVQSGNWNATRDFLKDHPAALTARILTTGGTVLHAAIEAEQEHIVKELVNMISEQHSHDLLTMQDYFGTTALHQTAESSDNYRIAECLIEKNKSLVNIRDFQNELPVSLAMCWGHKELARYLYPQTPLQDLEAEEGCHGASLLNRCFYNRDLDMALDLMERCPRLAFTLDHQLPHVYPLEVLAYNSTDAFECEKGMVFWKRWIYDHCIHISLDRAAAAADQFRLNIIQNHGEEKNIGSVRADLWRQLASSLLNLLGKITENTAIDHIRGAALQMQREVQWFKEVERISPLSHKEFLNKDGLTPRQLFTKDHQEMRKEGEKWMKDTATSCTVVGALITTIMFAAAFTIPGGDDQTTGLPILMHDKLFELFIVADSLSLFSSSTSILMFLGILTSRYAEDDFLRSLPNKMIIGLFALFFSIATMMIAFSAALLLMFHRKYQIVTPIIGLAGVPIILFVFMKFRLLVDMFVSTYRPGIFDRKRKPWF